MDAHWTMYITYLRRELLRRKRTAIVIATGLAIGISLVITVSSVSAGMERAQRGILSSLYGIGTDMTVTKPPAAGGPEEGRGFGFEADNGGTQNADRVFVQGGSQTLDASATGTVASQDGVAAAAGGLQLQVLRVSGQFNQGQITEDPSAEGQEGAHAPTNRIEGGSAEFDVNNFTVLGVDVTAPALGPMTSLRIASGTGLAAAQPDAKVAVVDSAYAAQAKLKVGDKVTVNGTAFDIVGLATAAKGSSVANVYLPLGAAQTLAKAPGKISTVYVKVADSTKIGTVKSAVQQSVPGTTVVTSADLAQTVSGSLTTASDLANRVGRWLSFAVLLAAFLIAALLTSSAVNRRVREFGTLKALGWTSGRVTRQVMGEALVNGLVGGALGIGLGVAAAKVIDARAPMLTAQLGSAPGLGESGELGGPGAGGSLQVLLTAPVSGSIVAIAVALAVAGGLVAGTYGGWRASRLRPADALRRIE